MTDPAAAPVLVLRAVVPATPHACLSPNGRCHWRTKAAHAKDLRTSAEYAAMNAVALAYTPPPPGAPIWLDVEIVWPKGRRTLDWTNAAASCKAIEDGIFDAIRANDRQVAGVAVRQSRTADRQGETRVSVYAGLAPWGGGAGTEERT